MDNPIAEAQDALHRYERAGVTERVPGLAHAFAKLLTYTSSLLEPLGDEGRALAAHARNTADIGVPDFTNSPLLRQLSAYIERQSAALAARDERIRAIPAPNPQCGKLYIEGWEAAIKAVLALTGGTSHE